MPLFLWPSFVLADFHDKDISYLPPGRVRQAKQRPNKYRDDPSLFFAGQRYFLLAPLGAAGELARKQTKAQIYK